MGNWRNFYESSIYDWVDHRKLEQQVIESRNLYFIKRLLILNRIITESAFKIKWHWIWQKFPKIEIHKDWVLCYFYDSDNNFKYSIWCKVYKKMAYAPENNLYFILPGQPTIYKENNPIPIELNGITHLRIREFLMPEYRQEK
jgi:hypothetical protein